MKKRLFLLLAMFISIVFAFVLTGCKRVEEQPTENQPVRMIVELNENNYWKYLNVSQTGNIDDEKPTVFHEINGVLDYALYEDVVFFFDVIYYTDGQTDDQYQSYTMRIACNAAGDAAFETTYLGYTNVTVGKWLGADGELVSFLNYNWKIHFKSVSGNVIYTA